MRIKLFSSLALVLLLMAVALTAPALGPGSLVTASGKEVPAWFYPGGQLFKGWTGPNDRYLQPLAVARSGEILTVTPNAEGDWLQESWLDPEPKWVRVTWTQNGEQKVGWIHRNHLRQLSWWEVVRYWVTYDPTLRDVLRPPGAAHILFDIKKVGEGFKPSPTINKPNCFFTLESSRD